jgi:predicted small lipoprotein YifL
MQELPEVRSALVRSAWALAFAGAVALALGACGRKSGLDLPPSAAAQQTPGSPAGTGLGPDGKPVAAPGQKRRILLDTLLD